MSRMLAIHGLTGPQFDILATLASGHDGATQQDLARQLLVAKGNITVVIDHLHDLELVERRSDPRDARLKRIFLKRRGRLILARIAPDHRAALGEALGELDSSSLVSLATLLSRVGAGVLPDDPPGR